MRKTVQTVGLAVIMLLVVVLLAGCPKAPPAGEGVGPPPARATTGPPAGQAVSEPGTLAEALKVRAALTSYEVTMTIPEGETVTQVVKLEAGEPVRMKIEQEEGWVIMDIAEKVMYMYSPEADGVLKMPMDVGEGAEEMPVVGPENFETDVPILGSDTLDGVECWVVETLLLEEKDEASKVWIDKEYGLLRQAQQGEEIVKFEYDKINEEPYSAFELPEGVEVMDMSEMLEGMMKQVPDKP